MKQPIVYLMASSHNGTLYTGVTSDLIKRAWQHREGAIEGFTKRYGCKTLVWFEHPTMESAIHREKRLKKYTRAQKTALIEKENPDWHDLYPSIVG